MESAAKMSKDASSAGDLNAKKKYLDAAKELEPVFRGLISPIAECFQNSTKTGLSVQRIREILVPAAQILQQIISNQADEELGGKERHEAFWQAILAAPGQVDNLRVSAKQKKCAEIVSAYKVGNSSNVKAYPRISDYAELPYLYVAAAALMRFVNETDLALKILDDASPKVKEKDYRFNTLRAEYSYYLGHPVVALAGPLEEMRETAVRRWRRLDRHCALVPPCDSKKLLKIAELRKRDRLAEVAAMNNLAYRVAEDRARGVNSARDLLATAARYADELRLIVKKNEDGFSEEQLNAFKDTFAYTFIVLEADKPNPDRKVFKEMAIVFKGVMERLERTPLTSRDRSFYVEQNILRTHLRSATELAGEGE